MASWSDLSRDVFQSILSRLSFADFIRSRAVCRSWRSTAADLHRIPFLMFAGNDPSTAGFFSVSDGRTYTIRLPNPDIHQRVIVGSSHGWLVTIDEGLRTHLLNPLTGAQIELPSLGGTLAAVEAGLFAEPGVHPLWLTRPPARGLLPPFCVQTKAALSSSPSVPDDCTVVLLHQRLRLLTFARVRDKSWTLIKTDHFYDDITNNEGRLFLVQRSGAVDALDLTSSSPKPSSVVVLSPQIMEVSHRRFFRKYLVPTPSGGLLQVWRAPFMSPRIVPIRVYKIDTVEGQMSEVRSLGDLALFLGRHSSACSSVAGLPEWQSNHVYLIDDDMSPVQLRSHLDIHVYNLEDESMEPSFAITLLSKLKSPTWVTVS